MKYKPFSKMENGMFMQDFDEKMFQQEDCVVCMEHFHTDGLIVRMPKC